MRLPSATVAGLTVRLAFVLLFAAANFGSAAVAGNGPPAAPQVPVVDDYFGTKVTDPYRWMEDGKNPAFLDWLTAQSRYTQSVLDAIPNRDAIKKAIVADSAANPNRVVLATVRGQSIFTLRKIDGKKAPILFVRTAAAGADRLLVDPSATDDGHAHDIVEFAPSWDGKRLAYRIDTDGNETGAIRLIDVESLKQIGADVSAPAAYEIAWLPDNQHLTYQYVTSNDATGVHRVALHDVGSAFSTDRDILSATAGGPAAFAGPERGELTYAPDSPYAVLGIATSDAGRRRFFVSEWKTIAGGTPTWRPLAAIGDGVTSAIPHGNNLYFVSNAGAPRYRVFRTSATSPDISHAEVVVAESDAVIQGPGGRAGFALAGYNALFAARDALYVALLEGGSNAVLRVPWEKPAVAERLRMPYAVGMTDFTVDPMANGCWFGVTGWVHAGDHLRYDPASGRVASSGLQTHADSDNPTDLTSEEVVVTARDGVKVPLSLIHRTGLALNGSNPTILYGYGAYGAPMTPFLIPSQLIWYRLGGIVAIVHARGGGDFGEAWHLAGKGATKPNTWRDAIDSADYLVAQKYTSPSHLGVFAGSVGGILAGRAITERPDLFAAAVLDHPFVDTLRFEAGGMGKGNRNEFGSVATLDGFRGLDEMSTYRHVRSGVRYPAVLLMGGLNDRRIAVWEPAKVYAALHAASKSGKPVLLRIDGGGHGLAPGEDQLDRDVDLMAFMLWQLEAPGYQPARSATR